MFHFPRGMMIGLEYWIEQREERETRDCLIIGNEN